MNSKYKTVIVHFHNYQDKPMLVHLLIRSQFAVTVNSGEQGGTLSTGRSQVNCDQLQLD